MEVAVVIIRKMGLQPSMVSKMVSPVPCEQPPSEWNFHTNSGAENCLDQTQILLI